MYNKQLLDEVYCDMKIINVEVRVISLSILSAEMPSK